MKNILLLLPILLFASCSKDDPEPAVTIDAATVELKYDKEHQFVLTQGTGTVDASTYTWTSSDTLIGKVDKTGKFIARKIGETTVKGTLAGKVVESKVTVTPYITSFKEPYVEFGATTAVVKTKETRKLLSETATILAYQGENAKILNVLYLLETGKLSASALLFEESQSMADDVITFYSERYPRIGAVEENLVVFLNDEANKAIEVGVSEDLGFYAVYSAFDSKGLRSAKQTGNIKDALSKSYKDLKNK